MDKSLFASCERLDLECQVPGDYWEESKTIILSIDDFFKEHNDGSCGYPVINSPFCGSVNRAFFPLAQKLIKENYGKVLVITFNKLQSDFIKSFFSNQHLDCQVIEESAFTAKCRKEKRYCDGIYDNIKFFLVYTAEDIPSFVRYEMFFNYQSFWLFVDESQILPQCRDGKWNYPNLVVKNDRKYNVGILGNQNITLFSTYLNSSTLPDRFTNNGFDGAKPQFLETDNQLAWIIHKIRENQTTKVALLFQRDTDVKQVYEILVSEGINVEVKYNINGDEKDTISFKTKTPKLMTYYNSKGILFDTVIMPINSLCNNNLSRRLVTIATSTAYNNLYVIYDEMPELFKNIPSSLYCDHS